MRHHVDACKKPGCYKMKNEDPKQFYKWNKLDKCEDAKKMVK